MSPDDLPVGRLFTIPAAELRWRFDTSGGPGGQHANKSATRAELSWDLDASGAIDDALRNRMLARLGGRAPGGVVTVTVDESRSQWRNRAMARRRLVELLTDAARTPKRRRRTRPTAASRRRRLEHKRRRAEVKRMRRRVEPD